MKKDGLGATRVINPLHGHRVLYGTCNTYRNESTIRIKFGTDISLKTTKTKYYICHTFFKTTFWAQRTLKRVVSVKNCYKNLF